MWFKKKQLCVHCKERKTHRRFADEPTCPECEISVLTRREGTRSCPADGAALQKTRSGEIFLDRCPVCKGVWFDASELEAIQAAAKDDSRFAEGFVVGMLIG